MSLSYLKHKWLRIHFLKSSNDFKLKLELPDSICENGTIHLCQGRFYHLSCQRETSLLQLEDHESSEYLADNDRADFKNQMSLGHFLSQIAISNYSEHQDSKSLEVTSIT